MKKKTTLSKVKAVALTICTCLTGTAIAQPPVLPTGSDVTWFNNGSSPVHAMNTAMLNYGSPASAGIVAASVYVDGSGGAPVVHAIDPGWGGSCSASLSSNMNLVGNGGPDIIIGNWDGVMAHCSSCTSTSTDFIVAVFYVATGGAGTIDYYDLYDDGISTMTLSLITSTTPFGGYSPQTSRIDVIAAANGNPLVFPPCYNFVVAFDDPSGSPMDVYVAEGDLNTQSITVGPVNVTGAVSSSGTLPDVAGVQRAAGGGGGGVNDVAIVTYRYNGNQIHVQECDFSGPTVSSATVLDNGSGVISNFMPRIDAQDDYSLYSAMQANYKVAAMVNVGGIPEIRTYDDLMGAGSNWVSSSVVDQLVYRLHVSAIPGGISRCFYVRISGISGISLYRIWRTAAGNNDEPILNTASTSLWGGSYYWVNNTRVSASIPPPMINASSCLNANSVSSPPNWGMNSSIYAWAEYNGSTYDVKYKLTTTPSIFGFKQSPSAVSGADDRKWKIYPNPADDHLLISNGTGTNEASRFQISDMLGRVLWSGNLATGAQVTEVRDLPAGLYVIQLFSGDRSVGQELVTKN